MRNCAQWFVGLAEPTVQSIEPTGSGEKDAKVVGSSELSGVRSRHEVCRDIASACCTMHALNIGLIFL